jgi:hypothetical protein
VPEGEDSRGRVDEDEGAGEEGDGVRSGENEGGRGRCGGRHVYMLFVCFESRRVEMCWGWDRPAKEVVGVESKATEECYAGTSDPIECLCADAN